MIVKPVTPDVIPVLTPEELEANQLEEDMKSSMIALYQFDLEKAGQLQFVISRMEQADSIPPQTEMLALDEKNNPAGMTQYKIACDARDLYLAEAKQIKEVDCPEYFEVKKDATVS